MNKKKEVVFDPQMVANYREMASNLVISDEIVRRLLDKSTTIDNQTKVLLRYISRTSLNTCSFLYRLSAFNMSLLNDIEQVIDDLPDQFYYIKIKFRNLVKSTKEKHDYQRWAEILPDIYFNNEGKCSL
jgi:hypothetical protein